MNDAKCDARGRWFAGSMAYDNTRGAGALYRVDLDGSVSKILAGTTISNGLGFSADDTTFFFNDSGEETFSRYTFDADAGTISDQQVLVRGKPGTMPDGLTVDDEGCVWASWYDGGAVRRYSPAGEHLATVRVPVKRTSSCTFAGPDRDLLVISTGRADDDPAPEKGRLFCCRPGVTGPAAVPFAGSLPR